MSEKLISLLLDLASLGGAGGEKDDITPFSQQGDVGQGLFVRERRNRFES